MDIIHVREFPLKCRIGVSADERKTRQTVLLTIALRADLRAAGRSDDIGDTVDYAALMGRVEECARAREYRLLESLARHIAAVCLNEKLVRSVVVTVEKRGVISAPVAVEIRRSGRIHK